MPKARRPQKRKVKRECAFLYFVAYNPHEKQSKNFLKYLLRPEQYTVLRELAVNYLANNIPNYTHKKRTAELKEHFSVHIERLAEGKLKKEKIHHLFPIIQLWAQHALKYHELC